MDRKRCLWQSTWSKNKNGALTGGINVLGQPEEKSVGNQFGEKEAQGEFNHSLYKDKNVIIIMMGDL